MWLDYYVVMELLETGQSSAYKIIRKLQKELEQKGYLVNPHAKIPVRYFCERFGLDEAEVRQQLIEIRNKKKQAH